MKNLFILLLLTLASCEGGVKYSELKDKGNIVGKISDDSFLKIKDTLCIVQFSADYCNPCKRQYPNMAKVSKEYENIKFYILDVKSIENYSSTYSVNGIPQTLVFYNGKEIEREHGYCDTTELRQLVNSVL